MKVLTDAGLFLAGDGATYREHLRVPFLSLGTYSIPAGGRDPQNPHTEDEVYVVLGGHGRLWTPQGSVEVECGSVVFVPAGEEHRFIDIDRDLTVLVIFGPAEHTAGNQQSTALQVDDDDQAEAEIG
ncbi:cupin domain-containing protein [Sphaerimonospora mesophila]|uniref:cupin domain-containing protein n=1 Tax=Sphaerimonospora mesophila TaxID=37483 RepID=UPI0006E3940A